MKRSDRTPKPTHRARVATTEPATGQSAAADVSREARPRSRRDFMRLMAAGASAMLAAPAAAAAVKPAMKKAPADTTGRMRRARTETAGGHPMLPAELEKQKKYTADSLKTLRNYVLPPGAAPAYVFRPLAPRARRSRP